MYWIVQFIIQHRTVSSLFCTVILSLWMLTADTMQQQRIARTLTLSIFYPFQFTVHQTSRIKNIFAENKKLKVEITSLSTRVALLEQARTENERLRALIGFDKQFSHTLLPARAVARDPSSMSRTIVINCGRKQGASLFMPVVNKGGVVGKIIQVLPNISLVHLLKDPSERTSVMIKKNQEVGILETIDSKTFFVQYRKHADIAVGDSVVTSGLGGIYPTGLNIGTVAAVKDNSEDPLFKVAVIKTSIDFNHIEEVFVMQLDPQWAAFRSELDSIEVSR